MKKYILAALLMLPFISIAQFYGQLNAGISPAFTISAGIGQNIFTNGLIELDLKAQTARNQTNETYFNAETGVKVFNCIEPHVGITYVLYSLDGVDKDKSVPNNYWAMCASVRGYIAAFEGNYDTKYLFCEAGITGKKFTGIFIGIKIQK